MSHSYRLATTDSSKIFCSDDNQYKREVWFKSQPLTLQFCRRVFQLQLSTYSHDQGFVGNRSAGSWSWFEVAIFENEHATEPRKNDGDKVLSWRSHANRIGVKDPSMSFGIIFDRRSELLDDLEVSRSLTFTWYSYLNVPFTEIGRKRDRRSSMHPFSQMGEPRLVRIY